MVRKLIITPDNPNHLQRSKVHGGLTASYEHSPGTGSGDVEPEPEPGYSPALVFSIARNSQYLIF